MNKSSGSTSEAERPQFLTMDPSDGSGLLSSARLVCELTQAQASPAATVTHLNKKAFMVILFLYILYKLTNFSFSPAQEPNTTAKTAHQQK